MKDSSMVGTWAPWRTRISTPLLSIDIRAASSTSASLDKSSFRGFEKVAFSSYNNILKFSMPHRK